MFKTAKYFTAINSLHIVICLVFGVSYFIDPYSYFINSNENTNNDIILSFYSNLYLYHALFSVVLLRLDKDTVFYANKCFIVIYVIKIISTIYLQLSYKINNWSNITLNILLLLLFSLPYFSKEKTPRLSGTYTTELEESIY